MENLKKYTPTELLKKIQDTKKDHDKIKEEIIQDTYKIEELEEFLEEKINKLNEIENLYVKIIEEFESR